MNPECRLYVILRLGHRMTLLPHLIRLSNFFGRYRYDQVDDVPIFDRKLYAFQPQLSLTERGRAERARHYPLRIMLVYLASLVVWSV